MSGEKLAKHLLENDETLVIEHHDYYGAFEISGGKTHWVYNINTDTYTPKSKWWWRFRFVRKFWWIEKWFRFRSRLASWISPYNV